MSATRLPGKPLLKVNGLSIISHVFKKAEEANIGEVVVATEDQEIMDDVKKNGGQAILTEKNHKTGTDRIYEVFEKTLKSEPDIIINLQGDMPNLDPKEIVFLSNYLKKGLCDIATLAAILKNDEVNDQNVVKVFTKQEMKKSTFSVASDFHRNITNGQNDFAYHHIGIYGFTKKALIKYVNQNRSKLELERNLEQLRALENQMTVHVGFLESTPLSVDTEEDLIEIKKLMNKL